MMKKMLRLALACVLSTSVLAGCSNGSNVRSNTTGEGSDTSNTTYKIGGTGPLTGGAAIYGNAVKNGAQIAINEINELSGIQFELRYEDDEHDAEKAVNAYNTLKDWGMQIFLSSVTSTPAVATSTEAYHDRYFGLTPSASASSVTAGNDNIYQMCFSDPNQGLASAQYIYDNNLATRIAVIYKNDDVYSKGVYDTFIARAQDLGLEVVSETTFTEDSQTDFSVQLTDAQSKDADLIFLPIYYTPASLIFRQANTMGYAPKYFGIDGMDGILTLEGFDPALAEGVMLLTPFNADSTDAKTVSFVHQYQDAYGEIPNQFAANAYDSIYAIYEAIQVSNGQIQPSTSAAETCDALIAIFNEGFTFDGITGEGMIWNSSGEVFKAPKGMIIQNEAYVGMD